MYRTMTQDEKLKAMQKSTRRTLREHALLGRSVPWWRDGKVVYVSPREVIATLKPFEEEDGQVIPEYAPFIHGEQPAGKPDPV